MADLSSAERNAINLHMRQQPWYSQWFASKGLNPNQVKLSDAQRKELASVAASNGMPIPAHTLIDQAGNVNIQHGFAGLPTWAKIAIASGAALTGVGAAGGFGTLGSIFGIGGAETGAAGSATGAAGIAGAGGAGVGSGLTIPTLSAVYGGAPIVGVGGAGGAAASTGGTTIGSILGMGGGAAPKVGKTVTDGLGLTTRDIVKAAIPTGINAATGLITAWSQGKQADRAMQAEIDAAKYSTDAQSAQAAAQLKFLQEQEAQRKAEFDKTQALNLDQYNAAQSRLAPYRSMGQNALNLFSKPLTLGSVMGVA